MCVCLGDHGKLIIEMSLEEEKLASPPGKRTGTSKESLSVFSALPKSQLSLLILSVNQGVFLDGQTSMAATSTGFEDRICAFSDFV